MEAHLETPIPITELSSNIEMSSRQLERLFKSELSQTPARYYLNLRLDRARKFIRQTSLNIQEIAVATGFSSASYFSKSYKSRFRLTPLEERANA